MKFWTGVTDNDWFSFLSQRPDLDEVNFWHPGGRPPFTTLPEGTPFLFKLKAPHHHIAGGAYFVKYEELPLSLAWDAFGEKNGAATFRAFAAIINPARKDPNRDIGCSILAAPFFLPRHLWISVGGDFSSNVVRGKSFDTSQPDGARLWDAVQEAMVRAPAAAPMVTDQPVTFGPGSWILPRRGQGAFRALVTNAYARRCAITGESTLPVLEAAHIKSVADNGPNNTDNGLLLRSDFHKLFDAGLVTVTPDYRVVVSERIKLQWFNGKAYNRLHGAELASLPSAHEDRPRADFLRWHNDNVFERAG